jgi:hypothetical protein
MALLTYMALMGVEWHCNVNSQHTGASTLLGAIITKQKSAFIAEESTADRTKQVDKEWKDRKMMGKE